MNGIRRSNKLRVLQYRTTYINGSTIVNNYHVNGMNLAERLKLVDVAYMEESEVDLTFLEGNSNDVWPSMSNIYGLII